MATREDQVEAVLCLVSTATDAKHWDLETLEATEALRGVDVRALMARPTRAEVEAAADVLENSRSTREYEQARAALVALATRGRP